MCKEQPDQQDLLTFSGYKVALLLVIGITESYLLEIRTFYTFSVVCCRMAFISSAECFVTLQALPIIVSDAISRTKLSRI